MVAPANSFTSSVTPASWNSSKRSGLACGTLYIEIDSPYAPTLSFLRTEKAPNCQDRDERHKKLDCAANTSGTQDKLSRTMQRHRQLACLSPNKFETFLLPTDAIQDEPPVPSR